MPNFLKAVLTLSYVVVLSTTKDTSTAETVAYCNENIAEMDFMNPAVSIFEMRKRIAKAMPVPEQVMNMKVRKYLAREDDLFLTLPDGRFEQELFEGVELKEVQSRKLRKFHEWLSENEVKIPKGFSDYPEDLRVLQSQDYDHQKTVNAMSLYDKDQRKRVLPLLRDYEKYTETLNNGVAYGYSRDRSMKPITWINMRKFVDVKIDVIDFLD